MWTERLREVAEKNRKREFTFCCPICQGDDRKAWETVPSERRGLGGFNDESGCFHVHAIEYRTTNPQETSEGHLLAASGPSRAAVCCGEPHTFDRRSGRWQPHEPQFSGKSNQRTPKSRALDIRTIERQAREQLLRRDAVVIPEKLAVRWELPGSLKTPRRRPPYDEDFKQYARSVRAEILRRSNRIGRAVASYRKSVASPRLRRSLASSKEIFPERCSSLSAPSARH